MHVSNMSKTRASSAKDLVKRGQEVWVKVISLLGQKISLSMRDVDQVLKSLNHVTLSRITSTHIRGCFKDSLFVHGDDQLTSYP